MKFSEEEREKIDKILADVEEEQKQNGNQLYIFEEVVEKFSNKIKKEKKYSLRNISY